MSVGKPMSEQQSSTGLEHSVAESTNVTQSFCWCSSDKACQGMGVASEQGQPCRLCTSVLL
ncbi:hypothetical protein BDZ91DRAFT_733090 [Kalaharituber pfeilii]|nr:hypothetical protein BDZ91DRAFT_733090 [Kalaharituber pfeilii]